MTIFGIMHRYKKAEIFQGESRHQKKIKEHACVIKMDKQRLRVALKVLEEVKVKFPNTKQLIDDTMKEECQKEKITADEVCFFYKSRTKSYLRKTFFVLQ